MDDLFGAYLPKEARPVHTLSHQKSLDLLSFDSPSTNKATPAKSGRQVKDVSQFVSSSPVAQWKEASPVSRQQPFGVGIKGSSVVDDEFGEFQGNADDQSVHQPHMNAAVLSPLAKESRVLVLTDDEDEFGDFVDSPLPTRDAFPIDTVSMASAIEVPGPTDLLKFLLEHVLQVPTSFISELASVSYSLRKVVLNNPRTKKWLKAILEGAKIAQRIIQGRNRRVKDAQKRREAQITSDRVAQHWKETLMPRLSSLAGGTMKFHPLKTNAFNDNYSEDKVCRICTTEDDESILEKSGTGELYHKSCMSLSTAYKV